MPKPVTQSHLLPCSSPLDRRSHASRGTCVPAYTDPSHNGSSHRASAAASYPSHTPIRAVPDLASRNSSRSSPTPLPTGDSVHTEQSCHPRIWLYPSINHLGRSLGVLLRLHEGACHTLPSSRGTGSSESCRYPQESLSPPRAVSGRCSFPNGNAPPKPLVVRDSPECRVNHISV